MQPEHAAAQFDRYTLAKHFKPIVENDWVPITRSTEETEKEIIQAIINPLGSQSKRSELVENYVQFRDGRSSDRVVDWIVNQVTYD